MKRALAILTVVTLIVLLATGSAQANTQKRTSWPPHHLLWGCIHDNEGTWHDTRNPYQRGGLQLHFGWGYGTSYDASQDSQMVQEWGAELAYIANGYSHDWLIGQWLEWDKAYYCLKYA